MLGPLCPFVCVSTSVSLAVSLIKCTKVQVVHGAVLWCGARWWVPYCYVWCCAWCGTSGAFCGALMQCLMKCLVRMSGAVLW